jgi:hypothetical protein
VPLPLLCGYAKPKQVALVPRVCAERNYVEREREQESGAAAFGSVGGASA